MGKEGSKYPFYSNRHGDHFDIVPFGISIHPFPAESALQISAITVNYDEQYHPSLKSLPQTPAKSTECSGTITLRDHSGVDLPQTPLKPTRPLQLSTPQSRPISSPRTPVNSARRHQPSTPQSYTALTFPMTSITPTEPHHPETTQNHLAPGSPQKTISKFSEFHCVKAPGSPSALTTPSQSNLRSAGYTYAGIPIHRSLPVSPPETPSRSSKASCWRHRRRKPSMGKLQSSKAIKLPESYLPAGGVQPQESPGLMKFVNLTSEDSAKILAGVAPSGSYRTMIRRERDREKVSRL